MTSLARTMPPAVARMIGPGTVPPYVQVATLRPPSETVAGLARNTVPRAGPLGRLRRSAVATSVSALVATANVPVNSSRRERPPPVPHAEPFTTDPPIHLAR
ncbi:hypothetical protein GCM10020001_074980 [Nonomuraea salmonea]